MKSITVFLAIVILGLMTLPCTDTVPSSSKATIAVSFLDSDGSADFEIDFCSPFCSCHCCHTHLVTDIADINEPIVYPYDLYLSYYDKGILEPTFSIFQPPKI